MIIKVKPHTIHYVTLGDEWPNEYERHGPHCWMVAYGMSLEEVVDCEDLEAEFQEFIKNG